MAEYLIKDTTLVGIANKVRQKTGSNESIICADIESKIDSILTPTDGSIATKTSTDLYASGATVTVPSGYYASQAAKTVDIVEQATPSISVSGDGLITASSTQTAGYVYSDTKSTTKHLTTQAAKTITPGVNNQIAVASGVYTTGTVTVSGDVNLVASNIIAGKSIFGISGIAPQVITSTNEVTVGSSSSYPEGTLYVVYE